MSKKRKVINAYRPRIELGTTVKTDELVSHIKENSPFSTGTIRGVLIDLHDAIVHFNLSGRPVKVEGLGVFSPGIGVDGVFSVSLRPDRDHVRRLNDLNVFKGNVLNRSMIGKTPDQLVARWNKEHPDDPVE